MDGIRPQKKAQRTQKNAGASTAGGWDNGNSSGGLPSAPGAQLDPALMRQTLATPAVPPRPSADKVVHPPATNTTTGAPAVSPQPFDVFVVLDFEATCEENKRIANPEVIEFPMVLVDARAAQPVAEFQRYVKPVKSPRLSAFCTELTGITQEQVDNSQHFPEVYREALAFLAEAGLGDAPPLRSYCVVTCGDWDLKVMLPAQMRISGQLGTPASFQQWCNIKKWMGQLDLTAGNGHTTSQRGKTPSGLPEMLRMVGLSLQGKHHSGIDDCRNIAAVLCALLQRGYVVETTTPDNVTGKASLPPHGSTIRWHAPPTSPPPLHSLRSSLADGQAAAAAGAATAPASVQKGSEARNERSSAPAPARAAAAASAAKASSSVPQRPVLRVDTNRNAVEELLGSSAVQPTFAPQDEKTISKFLSTLLRHKADQWRVPITANGYVLLDDALRQPQIVKRHLTPQDVALLVRGSDKQRFRLSYGADDGRLYLAAAQGHSLEGVEPELRALTSPEEVPVAVHGTYWRAWQLIESCGYMSTMTRQHIHFAKGLMHDGGVISGMRPDVQIFMYLDVAAVLRDAVPLYESSNGVILTPGVGETRQLPLRYVAKVVDRKTGRTLYPVPAHKSAQ